MATILNTNNPEYITWEYQQVVITILGGIRIEGLDRMRVTLKIQWKEQVVRHNLDLYNDAAVDKLVKRCAERFSLGTAFMGELVTALTNTLEQYRLEELKKGQVKQERSPIMEAPVKLTTSGRGKLTTCFAGEDSVVQVC